MQYLGMKCRHFSDRSRQPRLRQGQCRQGQRTSRPNQGLGPFGNRCHGHAFGKRGRSGCVCGFAHRRARKEDHGLARNLLHGPPGRDEPMQFHGSTRLGGFQSVLNKDIGKGRVMVDWQNVTAWDASILDTVVDNLIAERKNATPRASRFKTSTKTSRGQAKGRRRHAHRSPTGGADWRKANVKGTSIVSPNPRRRTTRASANRRGNSSVSTGSKAGLATKSTARSSSGT